MFVLCPHCEFLVGVDPRTGQPPSTCPKCGQPMESAAPVEDVAPATDVAPTPEATAEPAPATAAAEPEPGLPATPPPAPQLSADDVIAAMATKSSRKPRAKTKDTAAAQKPAPREPARRKRHEHEATTPASAAPAVEPPAPASPAPPRRSMAQRIAGWLPSRKPGTSATPSGDATPPGDAPREPVVRRKATVRPIPSLRDRAATRAAEASAAAAAHHVPAPPPAEMSEIEALSISDMPLEAPEVIEAVPVPAAPVDAAPVTAPAEPPAPIDVAPTVVAVPRTRPPTRTTAMPSFLRVRTAHAGALPARWMPIAVLCGLSMLLALQLVLAQRDTLAADARWRPTVEALCGLLRCSVPAWREPDAFTMLSRDVRPHPRAPGTLQIDASFRNDARWPQPWPRLVVSLSDVDGRVVGTRAFEAREYLGAAPTQNALAPGQTAAIHFAVVEPAPGIVAFGFEFR